MSFSSLPVPARLVKSVWNVSNWTKTDLADVFTVATPTWMERSDHVGLSDEFRVIGGKELNAEFIRMLEILRRHTHVAHHDIHALLTHDLTFGLDHGVLFRVIAQNWEEERGEKLTMNDLPWNMRGEKNPRVPFDSYLWKGRRCHRDYTRSECACAWFDPPNRNPDVTETRTPAPDNGRAWLARPLRFWCHSWRSVSTGRGHPHPMTIEHQRYFVAREALTNDLDDGHNSNNSNSINNNINYQSRRTPGLDPSNLFWRVGLSRV